MYAIYKLRADELDARFLDTLKAMFGHQEIEISVCEASQDDDETSYLLKSPANRERLLAAINNVARNENLVNVDVEDLR